MGMNARKRIYLDINPADRARLLASATAYAAGRRTYVVGAVSDVVAANAGRLDAAARETLANAIRPAVDEGDPIDAPAWTRALTALETAWTGNGVLDRFLEDESLFGEFLRTPVSEGGVESLVVEPPHIVVEVGA